MISDFLDRTADLERQASTQDASGGTINLPFTAVVYNVPIAIWSVGAGVFNNFMRRDFIGDHIIATNIKLDAHPGDRWNINGIFYIINGMEFFSNAAVLDEECYIFDTTKRII